MQNNIHKIYSFLIRIYLQGQTIKAFYYFFSFLTLIQFQIKNTSKIAANKNLK